MNITLSVDERIADEARRAASAMGKSLNQAVRDYLQQPLRAYTGLGKPAQGAQAGPDRGTKWIPTQHVTVRQLYVPGLYVRGRAKQLYETVFAQPLIISPAD